MTTITIRSGVEGDHHDPYEWQEVVVKSPRGLTTYRMGALGYDRITYSDSLGKVKVEFCKGRDLTNVPAILFQSRVGVSVKAAMRAHGKLELRHLLAVERAHRKCPGVQRWVEGYPGEALLVCGCGEVLDTTFDRSAVE